MQWLLNSFSLKLLVHMIGCPEGMCSQLIVTRLLAARCWCCRLQGCLMLLTSCTSGCKYVHTECAYTSQP